MECCICKLPSKYKCPECSFRTCSATCVKSHKFVYGCSGVSKPLKFIPAKDFTENNLQKDMNFLLDIARVSNQSFKLVTKLSRSDNRKRFAFLSSECRSQGIHLRLMPKAMSRHQINTSLFDKSEKVILWHIEWVLHSKSGLLKVETSGNRDDVPIAELISSAFLKLKELPLYILDHGSDSKSFYIYFEAGKVLIQESGRSNFLELNSTNTLRELLPYLSSRSEIIEFPTFHLSIEGFSSEMISKD